MEASSSQNGKRPEPSVQPENMGTQEQDTRCKGNAQGQSLKAIQAWLVVKLPEYLALEPSDIDIDAPFASYGLQSVNVVGLSGDLEDCLGREFSPTLVYDHPDIVHLAHYLVNGSATTTTLSAGPKEQMHRVNPAEPIAIIGMVCRFPG